MPRVVKLKPASGLGLILDGRSCQPDASAACICLTFIEVLQLAHFLES